MAVIDNQGTREVIEILKAIKQINPFKTSRLDGMEEVSITSVGLLRQLSLQYGKVILFR